MSSQRVHPFSSQTPQTWSTSQFASRPFAAQEPKRPPTQQDIENEALQQNKFEAFGLQLKEKHGTITPVEQEHLGMLQAKMDSFWAQRLERAKAQPNFLALTRNAQSKQASEPAAPVQPNLAANQPSGAASTTAPALPVQPKFTIGQPQAQYEQEADRFAERVMSMAPPATPNIQHIQRQAEEEQEEAQTKPLAATITPLVQRQPDDEEQTEVQPEPLAETITPLVQRQGDDLPPVPNY
ncbi:MAG: hypothetical protein HC839_01225, partial [Leptolyngbyaceae cyanobacterium RM2_2_21]|nr:hypothetical protein [Leptolyngbyaceae cyanobacterium RM2_2_21]